MNPEELKDWSLAGAAFLGLAKEAITLIPTEEKRNAAESALAKAESVFKQAESSRADELGFSICLRCWPPEIMKMNDDDVFVCANCEKSDSSAYNKKLKEKD
jgi:hypothetical protein